MLCAQKNYVELNIIGDFVINLVSNLDVKENYDLILYDKIHNTLYYGPEAIYAKALLTIFDEDLLIATNALIDEISLVYNNYSLFIGECIASIIEEHFGEQLDNLEPIELTGLEKIRDVNISFYNET